jgi:hypothetical protein
MTKLLIAAGLIFALWLHVYLTEKAYNAGYKNAEVALGATAEQCFAWWFGPNKKQHEYAIRQICKRCGP